MTDTDAGMGMDDMGAALPEAPPMPEAPPDARCTFCTSGY